MGNLTIQLEASTAQALDERFDNNDLASGAFIRLAELTDTYTFDPGAENFTECKSNFIAFAAQIQNPRPGTPNQAFVDLATALNNFQSPAAISSPTTPAPPSADLQPTPEVQTAQPVESDGPTLTVTIGEVGTLKFFDDQGTQNVAIPRIALEHYCKTFAGKDMALVRYLDQVYARASDQGITVADLDIQGVGAQKFKEDIIHHFTDTAQIWTFGDITLDITTVPMTALETTIHLTLYKGAVLLTDPPTGLCQIEIIDNNNEHYIFVMEDGQDLQAPTESPDFAKLDAIRWEILKEL